MKRLLILLLPAALLGVSGAVWWRSTVVAVTAPMPSGNPSPPPTQAGRTEIADTSSSAWTENSFQEWEDAAASTRPAIESALYDHLTEENAEDVVRAMPSAMLSTFTGAWAWSLWVQRDPAGAMEWLSKAEVSSESLLKKGAGKWLREDLRGLRDYIANLPEGPWKQRVTRAAIAQAIEGGKVEDAANWCSDLVLTTPSDARLFDDATAAWATKDARAAAAWARLQTQPAIRDGMLSAVARGIALGDAASALRFAVTEMQRGPVLNELIPVLARRWTATEPELAAAWTLQFPIDPDRQTMLAAVLDEWSSRVPDEMERWLSNQRSSPLRDVMAERQAQRLAGRNEIVASHLLLQMTDGPGRQQAENDLIERWQQAAPRQAAQWAHALPPGPLRTRAFSAIGSVPAER